MKRRFSLRSLLIGVTLLGETAKGVLITRTLGSGRLVGVKHAELGTYFGQILRSAWR
jgi:hypothetical protein